MGGFSEKYPELQKLNTRVIGISTDNLENSTAIAEDLSFPIAYGAGKAEADTIGSWWEEERSLIQPSDFLLNHEAKIISATYSSGPIGRLEAPDAVGYIGFQESLRQKA